MEKLTFTYPVHAPSEGPKAGARTHVGVVGSGDLEVLFEPYDGAVTEVTIRTSVDGYGDTWNHVLERFLSRYPAAVRIEINDFGATPGVVLLRLEQAAEGSRS